VLLIIIDDIHSFRLIIRTLIIDDVEPLAISHFLRFLYTGDELIFVGVIACDDNDDDDDGCRQIDV
jgi:hypothetical protein